MSRRTTRCKVGDLRPSQLIYTFGVGSIVDLPGLSAMVMGLDDWEVTHVREIGEERLLASIREQLPLQNVERLCSPPLVLDDGSGPPNPLDPASLIGVPMAAFPRWMRCPFCHLVAPIETGLFQLKEDRYRPDRTRYVHTSCQKAGLPPAVVPSRFLVACKRGHLDDFPWIDFVHHGAQNCAAPVIRIREVGVTGEASDIYVSCDTCKQRRPFSDAFGDEAGNVLPPCKGRRPHLRDFAEQPCPETVRTISLGASNSWFPLTLSALSIPQSSNKLGQLVEENWPVLEKAESAQNIALLRQVGVLRAFAAYDDGQLWQAIQAKRGSAGDPTASAPADLKAPEWAVFTHPDSALNSNDFHLTPVPVPEPYAEVFSQVLLVERLREVRALLGFTRIESPGDFGEPVDIPPEQQVSLSRRPPTWVPAAEVRGEGLFIQFNEERIRQWWSEVEELELEFLHAHRQWRSARKLPDPDQGFPGARYVLLHTFSHALMRQLSLECGYAAASIRERIYSREPGQEGGPMAGVLIYTAAPDSEGTLGGLVSLGRPVSLLRHLDQALEQLKLCTSDPLCAEHHPLRDGVSLHAAACHACLFSPETSCERGNRYLDRSVLVPTFGERGLSFFRERESGS